MNYSKVHDWWIIQLLKEERLSRQSIECYSLFWSWRWLAICIIEGLNTFGHVLQLDLIQLLLLGQDFIDIRFQQRVRLQQFRPQSPLYRRLYF
jgi:hypothetical protein